MFRISSFPIILAVNDGYESSFLDWVLPIFTINLGAVISHVGYDKLVINDREIWKAGSFFHQLHQRYFNCNYGSEEMSLDRWFDSFHDDTDEATKRIRERMRKRRSSKVNI